MSMKPGATMRPSASISSSARTVGSIVTIRPPAIPRSAR